MRACDNVAMPTPLNIANMFNGHSNKKGRTAFPQQGKIQMRAFRTLNRVQVGGVWHYRIVDDKGNEEAGSRISEQTAANHATTIENLSIGANHGTVKLDARWQTMHQRALRNLPFMNNAGAIINDNPWTYPCHYRGLILPEEIVQVDHKQPQAHPAVAVLKVLHHLGGNYTTRAGHGAIGVQAQDLANNNLAALQIVPVKEYYWDRASWGGNAFANLNHRRRYLIEPKGHTFLTVLCMYYGNTRVEEMCLNSLLNLVPACPICNGSSGKSGMTHAGQ